MVYQLDLGLDRKYNCHFEEISFAEIDSLILLLSPPQKPDFHARVTKRESVKNEKHGEVVFRFLHISLFSLVYFEGATVDKRDIPVTTILQSNLSLRTPL